MLFYFYVVLLLYYVCIFQHFNPLIYCESSQVYQTDMEKVWYKIENVDENGLCFVVHKKILKVWYKISFAIDLNLQDF